VRVSLCSVVARGTDVKGTLVEAASLWNSKCDKREKEIHPKLLV